MLRRPRLGQARSPHGRPYRGRAAILAAADRAAELAGRPAKACPRTRASASAPRATPRRPPGRAGSSRPRRQSDAATEAELIAANRAYEDRFGQVFLIFASGRSRSEILAAARERLANDEETERAIVAEQLRLIARLRLERLLDALG